MSLRALLILGLAATGLLAEEVEARAEVPAAGTDAPAPEALRPPPRPVTVAREAPPRLREALHDILQDPALDGADVGFAVWDVDADKPLATSGEELLVNPASNAKLLTSSAALSILRPDFRWKTEYYFHGPLKDGVLLGDLVVKGHGDPTVVTERLQKVVAELHLLGLRRIKGAVIVDDSYFDRVTEPRGWEMEEAPDRAYAAPVSGLNLNFNAIGIHIRPGEGRGTPAVVSVDPPVEYAYIDGDLETQRWARRLRVGTEDDRLRTKIVVSGSVGSRDRPRKIYRRIYDPPRYFGSALITFLNQKGIKVKHRVVRGAVPAGSRLVHVDQSPRLTKVISDLNHYSNNFIAETVVKTISAHTSGRPGSFDDGLARVRDFLEKDVGWARGSYTFGNGSGLNDVNRLTAGQVVQLLDHMHEDYDIGADFVASLAVAGTRGTIRSRMRDGPAERRLRAKTGTLTGVSALSGYVVDPRNRVLAFSILVQGWNNRDIRTSSIWDVQNRIGEALASDGETWAPVIEEPVAAEPVASADSELKRADPEPAKGGAP